MFDDDAPRAFGLPAARTSAVEGGGFIGDVRRGGSCNCETHVLTPHGDGTHTEGVGHLLTARVPVVELLHDALMPALVVRVTPVELGSVTDEVTGNHAREDRVVDQLSLEEAVARAAAPDVPVRALIIATQAPRTAQGDNPPYLTVDAALWLRARGVEHLLVDLPSLDRANDGGLLGAHRAFFDVPPRVTVLPGPPPRRTITELCAIPIDVAEGPAALSLQLAPLDADAVPSRPLLFPLVRAPLSFGGARPTSR